MTFTLHGPRFSAGPFFLPKFLAGPINRRDRSAQKPVAIRVRRWLLPPDTPLIALNANRTADGKQPQDTAAQGSIRCVAEGLLLRKCVANVDRLID
jgi:hypothetical protein